MLCFAIKAPIPLSENAGQIVGPARTASRRFDNNVTPIDQSREASETGPKANSLAMDDDYGDVDEAEEEDGDDDDDDNDDVRTRMTKKENKKTRGWENNE